MTLNFPKGFGFGFGFGWGWGIGGEISADGDVADQNKLLG